MRVLLTGVAGFIGSSVAKALIRRGDEVVGVDNFNAFYDPALKERNIEEILQEPAASRFELLRADLVDDEARVREVFDRTPKIDLICHLAAWAGVQPSIEKPLVYQKNNIEATTRLLELARAYEIRPFVFASSSSVYGARKDVPFSEEDRVDDPISPYAATKKACELIGYTYHHLFGTRFVALRFFTVYGPRQRPEMAIHFFARRILEGKPIPVFGDGSSSRDYTYIDDIVAGVLGAIDRAASVDGYRVYNLGNSEPTKLSDLVRLLEDKLQTPAIIDWRPDRPGDVPTTYADIRRAQSELGYRPTTPIEQGIVKFAEWLRERG